MAVKTINAELLAKMFLAGAANIEAHKAYINELNVFPVPDGDTGTNMSLTIMAAAREVTALESPTMKELAKAISSGSLRGARGNSGVILSQLLRGFTKVIRDDEEIDALTLASAVAKARDTAYKAVMKPKEGTILTVASGAAESAAQLVEETDDIEVMLPKMIEHMEEVLAKTPDMLPVLKEAGVVDSGGQGLVEIVKGMYDAFLGKEVDYSAITPKSAAPKTSTEGSSEEIKFGYCTEFIVNLEKKFTASDEEAFKNYLSSIGDSIVVVADDEVVKVHVHTNDPGLAIQKGLKYGSLTSMKIDNMREEHEEKLRLEAEKTEEVKADEPRKPVGFISVSIGEGLNDIFKELGVDYIIEGGQTMNPSTDDMLHAIDQVNAEAIFILPNNKNVILAANQAQALTKDKEIIVVPTKTVPQGITAIISYQPEITAAENAEMMAEEIKNVKTGQVTYAVRDTKIDDKEIHEGDIMGLGDKGILSVGSDIETVAFETLKAMTDEDSELISIYYGEEVKEEEANTLLEKVTELYPNYDVDLQYGGQPIYYYVMSVE
ncbi:DAK2 domain fusion protein YloV [Lachnospiraceae bacterium PF1-21]|uniref:DAK2 domain-containing protein n=1 Tax=Ohessyouella blattaphilus TaxID=2949333 RepID=UPI00255E5916|nr:DAK2 domain-containing protein [Lachnospiraceae bacterium OttesenSCG-928-J05]